MVELTANHRAVEFNDEYMFAQLKIAGLIEDLKNGTLRCDSCGKTLNASNVRFVASGDNLVKGMATRKNPTCISKARTWMDISFEKPNDNRR